jgi:protein-L-isoaspartate(D-aspartate) O-methyltransferase
MAHLTRSSADSFAAALVGSVFFIDFEGARDAAVSSELARVLRRDEGAGVRSLRCEVHVKEESCWLHGAGWCFSRLAANLQLTPQCDIMAH